MNSRFVLDASATIAWLFNEAGSAHLIDQAFNDAEPVVPPIWELEIVNVLLVKGRKRLLTDAEATHALSVLSDFAITVVQGERTSDLTSLFVFAGSHKLTAYDAAYLDLALTLGIPICTLDQAIIAAANASGVRLLLGPTHRS